MTAAIIAYLAIGAALLVYAWPDVAKPWGALKVLLGWPVIMVAGLYLIQRDRYEARRRGR